MEKNCQNIGISRTSFECVSLLLDDRYDKIRYGKSMCDEIRSG